MSTSGAVEAFLGSMPGFEPPLATPPHSAAAAAAGGGRQRLELALEPEPEPDPALEPAAAGQQRRPGGRDQPQPQPETRAAVRSAQPSPAPAPSAALMQGRVKSIDLDGSGRPIQVHEDGRGSSLGGVGGEVTHSHSSSPDPARSPHHTASD